ncbi:MAG: carotenoid biosynthesis protein, partial [Thermoproteota archaeon]|nr:carotenoid biosynthesis protein [Thermoproteota archaeon]
IIIPIAWFMMVYPSYIIATLIQSGRLMMREKIKNNDNNSINVLTPIPQILWLSFLSAVIMTAWDLVVDPYLSGPTERAWIWEDGSGQYFGVPLHNFGGWLLTTFTIYFLFQLLSERKFPVRSSHPLTTSIILLPLIGYGAVMVANIIPGEPPELRIIGPIVMGIPLAIAASRLLLIDNSVSKYYTKQSEQ